MVFHVSITLKQEQFISALDEKVLRETLEVCSSVTNRQETVFNCHCPFCHGARRKKESVTTTPHATANLFRHRNGEGLSFGCAACDKVIYSVHQLLCEVGRSDLADWYAQKRYYCDQACGRGWTCPNPSSVKQELSEKRRCMREEQALKTYQASGKTTCNQLKRPKPSM